MILSEKSQILARTLEFKGLIADIRSYFSHLESNVINAATNGESYETVRFAAGRLSGARYLLGVLEKAEKEADAKAG